MLPELPSQKDGKHSEGSRPSAKPVRIREEHPEPFETKRSGGVAGGNDVGLGRVCRDMGLKTAADQMRLCRERGGSMKCLEEPTQPAELKMFQLIQSQICQSWPRQRAFQRIRLSFSGANCISCICFNGSDPVRPILKSPVRWICLKDKLLTKPARANHRLIGQLFDTYWLVEYHDNLYIIDQHAAHEKILYERTMASLQRGVHLPDDRSADHFESQQQ
ncbi:MAG: hypothetical protein ACLR8P_09630 [Clostridium fessum]